MAGALENDLNPNTFIGLSFPLRKDNNSDFAMTKNSLEQAQHNLKNLLLTQVGERVAQPEFGSRLKELCFEPQNNDLPTRIEEEVRRSVDLWLPYINIQDVRTLTDDVDESKIFVQLTYNTSLDPESQAQIIVDASNTSTAY
jgi:phage baseplate assembly protein W